VNGRTIYLNGKIDRIDRAGNMYFVTDYKSGDAPKSNAFADTDLQLPLYLLAAERLLAAPAGGAVAGGGYLSLKAGERKESFLLPGTELKLPGKTFTEMKDADGNSLPVADMQDLQVKMRNVLTELLERMEQGDFTPTPVSGCDKHCPGAAVCRYRVLVRDREEEGSDG
jgi:RecB family exonuclease